MENAAHVEKKNSKKHKIQKFTLKLIYRNQKWKTLFTFVNDQLDVNIADFRTTKKVNLHINLGHNFKVKL